MKPLESLESPIWTGAASLSRDGACLIVRPAWVQSNGCKSRVRVDSVKHIAKDKGVHREVESEGSWRQTSGLTNRNHIRHMWAG